ncbi:MAG TPA: PRC-barrel domain-containing protein, partial [Acidimicrobiales bacterium]|nr:PRC-barrel domain-containing protein [Acidimicrobiales bacterium]
MDWYWVLLLVVLVLAALAAAAALVQRRRRAGGVDLPGRRVLTERGRELGAVADVEFDPATGAVTAVLVGQTTVAGDRLIGLGSYALVVKE